MKYWLYDAASKFPNKVAVLGEGLRITYSELMEQVEVAAANIFEITQSLEDTKIAILIENRLEYILLIHAFGVLDCIPVLINTRLTSEEITWQLSKLNLQTVIVSKTTIDKVQHLSTQLRIFSVDESLPETAFLSLKQRKRRLKMGKFNLDKIQSLVYTSGTTGKPKAAIIQYSNILASTKGSATRLGVSENDVWMLTIPMYHVGGLSILFRSCLNGTTVFLDKKFKTEQLIGLINKYNISIISLVPTMLQWLVTHEAFATPTPSLRLILLGGDRASVSLIEACENLNLPIATTYGMTETVSQVATAIKTQVFEKPLSVGKALDGILVKIIDQQNVICSPNQVGEIVVSGVAVIKGYYQESSLNFDENGFKTGDIGFLDNAEDLFILQRRVDLIISGGENIYPSEVEDVINGIPEIKSACVFGIEDPEWGQQPVVAVVLEDNATIENEDILNVCKLTLADFKVPKFVYFINELPRNSLGKINRHKLLEIIEQNK